MEAGATGDIAIAILRRNGSIGVPVYLWLGGAWVDFQSLTAAQFSTYVNARLAATTNPQSTLDGNENPIKLDGLTITRTQY